jgi:hypothetical protein
MGHIFACVVVQWGNISYEWRTFLKHNIYGNRLKPIYILTIYQIRNVGAIYFDLCQRHTLNYRRYLQGNTCYCPNRY